MPRTILIADADVSSRERIARIARDAGYRVLNARTPTETFGALEACPISAVVIDEDLLRQCDLGRLLLRAQVLVLSKEQRESMSQDVAIISKDAPTAELIATLVTVTGDPRFPGPRSIVSISAVAVDHDKKSVGTA